jgi:hypothetical protein
MAGVMDGPPLSTYAPRYCQHCGHPLLPWRRERNGYDERTGEPVMVIRWRCTGRKWWEFFSIPMHTGMLQFPNGEILVSPRDP